MRATLILHLPIGFTRGGREREYHSRLSSHLVISLLRGGIAWSDGEYCAGSNASIDLNADSLSVLLEGLMPKKPRRSGAHAYERKRGPNQNSAGR
jgi:hypothetical protein